MKRRLLFFGFLMAAGAAMAQVKPPAPYGVLPSARQLKWHEYEMYVLVHFTPTTFENKEWGYGDAAPSTFNPTQFDARQIVSAVRAGGFKGLILVAKHHDGFALWPTKTTEYNISKSPFRSGKGDMVKEFSDACRAGGLSFGVYCSPWDRNNPVYGTAEYVKLYREQLRELYTQYGPLFMSWHDGANGGDGYYGGARTTRKIDRSVYYGWDTTWAMTRKLQPGATIFSDIGWDVRWVGNERGEAATTSWATYTPQPLPGKTKSGPGDVRDEFNPMGTRNGEFWIPAECDVPLRKGWFYHPEEDSSVKSPDRLFDLYLKSVGRGGALDLGIAPDRRGLLHEADVKSLAGFGDKLARIFSVDFAHKAKLMVTNTRGNDTRAFGVSKLTDGDRYSYWATDDAVTQAAVELAWSSPQTFDLIRLREDIRLGQRIDSVAIDVYDGKGWTTAGTATSIGACRLVRFDRAVTTDRLRVRIVSSPVCPALSEIGVFDSRK